MHFIDVGNESWKGLIMCPHSCSWWEMEGELKSRSVCCQDLGVIGTLALKNLWVGRILKVVWHNHSSKSFSNVPINSSVCVWPREINLPISLGRLFHFRTVLTVMPPKGEIFIFSAANIRTFSQESTLRVSFEADLCLSRSGVGCCPFREKDQGIA